MDLLTTGQQAPMFASMARKLVASLSLPGTYALFSLKITHFIPCTLLAFLLNGAGFFIENEALSFPSKPVAQKEEPEPSPSFVEQLMPLADLLASAEGDYDSVNRGHAGDTPGGMTRLTGRPLARYLVSEVIAKQRGEIHAVGRYQFIPSTLIFAVNASQVSLGDRFDKATQDCLMAALIAYKRPYILKYLQSLHDDLNGALDDLAREWASVEYRNGRSYYSNGGNLAKISRVKATKMLRTIKDAWDDNAKLP